MKCTHSDSQTCLPYASQRRTMCKHFPSKRETRLVPLIIRIRTRSSATAIPNRKLYYDSNNSSIKQLIPIEYHKDDWCHHPMPTSNVHWPHCSCPNKQQFIIADQVEFGLCNCKPLRIPCDGLFVAQKATISQVKWPECWLPGYRASKSKPKPEFIHHWMQIVR